MLNRIKDEILYHADNDNLSDFIVCSGKHNSSRTNVYWCSGAAVVRSVNPFSVRSCNIPEEYDYRSFSLFDFHIILVTIHHQVPEKLKTYNYFYIVPPSPEML